MTEGKKSQKTSTLIRVLDWFFGLLVAIPLLLFSGVFIWLSLAF